MRAKQSEIAPRNTLSPITHSKTALAHSVGIARRYARGHPCRSYRRGTSRVAERALGWSVARWGRASHVSRNVSRASGEASRLGVGGNVSARWSPVDDRGASRRARAAPSADGGVRPERRHRVRSFEVPIAPQVARRHPGTSTVPGTSAACRPCCCCSPQHAAAPPGASPRTSPRVGEGHLGEPQTGHR